MTYKRLIGTLIVKDDFLVKSYGFNFYRPAGGILSALINLDWWFVDEIFIIDISQKDQLSVKLLSEIKKSGCKTPITYGGGIRNSDDVKVLLQYGVDRVLLETLLYSETNKLSEIKNFIGSQAIVASIPIYFDGNDYVSWYHLSKFKIRILFKDVFSLIDSGACSEYLIVDVNNEGKEGYFNLKIIEEIHNLSNLFTNGCLFYGGIDVNIGSILLKESFTVGVAYGNVNLEKELNMIKIRSTINDKSSTNEVRNLNILR